MDASDPFSFTISRRAPQFLDADGFRIEPDPLAQAWQELRDTFSQLHAQRLLEVMRHIFKAMPPGEVIRLEEEQDETVNFYLRFSNGWSLDEYAENAESISLRFDHRSEAVAPAWFPRDEQGFSRWKHWRELLTRVSIDVSVDFKPQVALVNLSTRKDGLRESDLPDIARALIGAQWQSHLDRLALDEATPGVGAGRGRPRF